MKSYIFKNPKLDFIELRYVEDINPDYAIGKFQSKQTYYKI